MLISCDKRPNLTKFGSDFSKELYLLEALRLNDNRLYDTPVNLQSCNLAGVPDFRPMCLLRKQFCMAQKVGRHNVLLKAANLP